MLQRLVVFTVSVVLLFASCKENNGKMPNGEEKLSPEIINNPATASGQGDTSMLPVFLFEETTHHFGEIVAGEKVSHIFKFKNTGRVPLVISQVTGSCGCTVPEYSKNAVEPGGNGEIKVTFDSNGKSGMESKTVTILANTIPSTKVLTISAEVTQPPKK